MTTETQKASENGGAPALAPVPDREEVERAPSPQPAVIDGRRLPERPWSGLLDRIRSLIVSPAEREEAELEGRLRAAGTVSRCNTIAVMSPRTGVGRTTCSFLLGNLLAGQLNLRCLALDADPDRGALGGLARAGARSNHDFADLVSDLESVGSAAELRRYVSELPSGLHLLAAPADADALAGVTSEDYGTLVAFLGHFYDVLLLDLGTGVAGSVSEIAVERADHLILVTTPDWVTASKVLETRDQLGDDARVTLVVNQAPRTGTGALEAELRRRGLDPWVTLPFDEQLAGMLESGAYGLAGLERATRVSVKRLGLASALRLV